MIGTKFLSTALDNPWIASRKKHLRILIICATGLAIGYVITHTIGKYYSFEINLTQSLPYHVLFVDKTSLPARGELLAFRVGKNRIFPQGTHFGKIVGGVGGDLVTVNGRVFAVNGRPLVTAKEFSKLGFSLPLGPTGVIPNGQYFVYTNHKDSYDSRYADIGWITPDQVVGRAVVLF